MTTKDLQELRDTLGGVQCDVMQSDNLAITLCGVYDDFMGLDDETGWSKSAVFGCDQVLDAIHAHYADLITKLRAERDAAIVPPVVWGGTYADLMAEFESAEGYPADDWIEKFERMPTTAITFDHAIDFLLNQLPMIEKHISCMSVVQTITDEGATEIAFHTGGWSGAESLIACMERQFWINYFLKRWVRGGHFYYEVVKPKAAAVIATDQTGGAT